MYFVFSCTFPMRVKVLVKESFVSVYKIKNTDMKTSVEQDALLRQ